MFRYGATAMQPNTWYHVAGVYDAAARDDARLPQRRSSTTARWSARSTPTQQDSPQNVLIGQRPSGRLRLQRPHRRRPHLQPGADAPPRSRPTWHAARARRLVRHRRRRPSRITAPAASAQVTDIVNVTADADDNVGVAGVQFFVDGVATGAEDTTAPYALAWDTRTLRQRRAHADGARPRRRRQHDASRRRSRSTSPTPTSSRTRSWRPASTCRRRSSSCPTAGCSSPSSPARSRCCRRRTRTPTRRRSCRSPTSARPACSRASTTSRSTRTSRPTTSIYVFYTLGHAEPRPAVAVHRQRRRSPARSPGSELVLYQDPQDANAEHHGGAITFGNDGKLYFTTGEHFDAARRPGPHAARAARSTASTRTARSRPTTRSTTAPARTGTRSGRSGCAIRTAPTTTRRPAGCSSATSAATTTRRPRRRSTSARAAPTTAGRTARAPARRRARARSTPTRTTAATPRSPAASSTTARSSRPSYQGSYFFADYTQNWIRRLTFDANGNVTGVVQLRAGRRLGRRSVRRHRLPRPRVRTARCTTSTSATRTSAARSASARSAGSATSTSNQPPIARRVGQPDVGPGAADGHLLERRLVRSRRPAADLLVDVRRRHARRPRPTRRTPTRQPGQYTVRLTVSDGVNTTVAPPITISAGSAADGDDPGAHRRRRSSSPATSSRSAATPPTPRTARCRPARSRGTSTSCTRATSIPGTPITGVKSGTFTIPTTGHDFSGNTRYRITLTVTDSSGLTSTSSR